MYRKERLGEGGSEPIHVKLIVRERGICCCINDAVFVSPKDSQVHHREGGSCNCKFARMVLVVMTNPEIFFRKQSLLDQMCTPASSMVMSVLSLNNDDQRRLITTVGSNMGRNFYFLPYDFLAVWGDSSFAFCSLEGSRKLARKQRITLNSNFYRSNATAEIQAI